RPLHARQLRHHHEGEHLMTYTFANQAANGTPAEGTPAAQRARLAEMFRQMPEVDHNGDPINAAPATTTPNFDAITSADPATALAVLKAAETLGIDHAAVNTLMDSASFVASVTGAEPEEITAAITARATPAMRMNPNPSQGRSG